MESYGLNLAELNRMAKEKGDQQGAVENNFITELDRRRMAFTGIIDKMVGGEKEDQQV